MAEIKQEPSPASPLHVVVFPWLALGHMIPFLELSKQLARRGDAFVTFVSTPRNAARLLGTISPELSARIRIATLELPAVEGLPEGAESTADLPPEKVGLLKEAFDGLAAPFADLIANPGSSAAAAGDVPGFSRKKPDWIILDFAHRWAWPIAEEHKIACAMFLSFPVAFLAFAGPKHENEARPRTKAEDYMAPPPWIPFPTALAYRRHEAQWMAAEFRPDDRLFHVHRTSCRLIILRSCPEAEPRLFQLTTELFAKPVVPAGLLLPDDDVAAAAAEDDQSFLPTMQWLDAQPSRSVIYVALGSEAPVTPSHVRELARGLDLSGARFLWALRRPVGLPDGFEARVAGRGVVRTGGWVPQVRVLAHGAVGAFLTHCGWGSTVEGLFRFGHPLVALPFVVDQGLVARMVADRGVGVEVPRNDGDGSFSGEDVAAAVWRVMAEEEGETLARNARELSRVLGDTAMHEKYVDRLVEHLHRYK